MKKLKKALIQNLVFSSLSGVLLILFHGTVARLFQVDNTTVFWMIGVALLFFAGTIYYETKHLRRSAILWIIIQDFLWVVGSAILMVCNPFDISSNGFLMIGGVAAVVLYFGVAQAVALREFEI